MDPLHIEHSPVKNSSFDRAIDYGVAAALAALLLFMPLAFGAVEAWSGAVAVCTIALLLLLVGLKVLRPRGVFVWSWAYLPIAIFLLWVVMQLIPLPAGLAGGVAAQGGGVGRAVLGVAPRRG